MKFLDNPFGGNTNRRHEQSGLLLQVTKRGEGLLALSCARRRGRTHFDDNINQLGQLTLLVVVLNRMTKIRYPSASCRLVRASLPFVRVDIVRGTYVGLPSVPSDLGQQQVDSEWGILIVQSVLDGADLEMKGVTEFSSPALYGNPAMHSQRKNGANLLPENLGSVTVSTDNPHPTIVCHRSGQLRAACNIHSYSHQVFV